MVDINPIAGYETYTEYITEVTWKTTPANPAMKWFGGVDDIIISPTVDIKKEYHLKGAGATTHRELAALVKGKKTFAARVPIQPQKIGAGYSWLDLFTLAQGGATQIDVLPSFTINRKSSTYNFVGLGAKCNTFKYSVKKDEQVNVELDALLGNFSTTAVTMGSGAHASDPGTEHLWWKDIYVKLDTVGVDALRDIEFTINNNLKAEPRIRQVDADLVAFIKPGPYHVQGKITLDFLDFTQFNKFIAGTATTIAIYQDGYIITLNGVKYSGTLQYDSNPNDLIAEPLPFDAISVSVAAAP